MDASCALKIARQKQMKDLAIFMKKCEEQIEKAAHSGRNDCFVRILFDDNPIYDLALEKLNQSYRANYTETVTDGCICIIRRKYICINWKCPKEKLTCEKICF